MSGRVLVFGSINLDLVTQTRFHPKPGQTVKGSKFRRLPGGKGANQALAAAWSYRPEMVLLIGATGDDGFARDALVNLVSAGVNLENVACLQAPTGLAFIVVNREGENTIVVTPGANGEVHAGQLAGLVPQAGDVLLTQNEVPADEIHKARSLAKSAGAITVHNAAPASRIPQEVFAAIDYLIVNESEALAVAGRELDDDPKEAARQIFRQHTSSVVLTLGAAGVFACLPQGELEIPAPAIEVVDTTGAGDAFCGTFASCLAQGLLPEDCLTKAVEAGSEACRYFGAQSVR